MSTSTRRQSRGALAVFLIPFIALFAVFFIAPIIYAIVQSLFTVKTSGLGYGPPQQVFVFFGNYIAALQNSDFLTSIGRVLLFAVIEVPLMLVASLILALLLDSGRAHFPRVFRVFYFMPYGVPGVIASLLWGFLYVPSTSPILEVFNNLGLHLTPLSGGSVLFSIANISLWNFAGYNMLIIIASLQSVSGDLYEAAKIDGASDWAIVRSIKLPLLRPTIILVTVFTIIGTLQLFVEPLVLKPLSSDINSNYTPNLSAYNQAFSEANPNLAAAMAVIVAVIAFVFSFGFLRLVNRKDNRAW